MIRFVASPAPQLLAKSIAQARSTRTALDRRRDPRDAVLSRTNAEWVRLPVDPGRG